mgnify:CR=1 FL=1
MAISKPVSRIYTVVVACGTAIATSTHVAMKLKEILHERGIEIHTVQCRVPEVPSFAENAHLVVATAQVAGTSNYRTLDELQARLDPDLFWRVHRSHLVNINKIKEIVPWFSRNYMRRMKDAHVTELPVSRAQTKRLRDYLKL